jgi:hypothetical protein
MKIGFDDIIQIFLAHVSRRFSAGFIKVWYAYH